MVVPKLEKLALSSALLDRASLKMQGRAVKAYLTGNKTLSQECLRKAKNIDAVSSWKKLLGGNYWKTKIKLGSWPKKLQLKILEKIAVGPVVQPIDSFMNPLIEGTYLEPRSLLVNKIITTLRNSITPKEVSTLDKLKKGGLIVYKRHTITPARNVIRHELTHYLQAKKRGFVKEYDDMPGRAWKLFKDEAAAYWKQAPRHKASVINRFMDVASGAPHSTLEYLKNNPKVLKAPELSITTTLAKKMIKPIANLFVTR